MSDASHSLDERPTRPPPPVIAPPGLVRRVAQWFRQPGVLNALPVLVLFVTGFGAPLIIVMEFSFLPSRTFGYHGTWTLENFERIFSETFYISYLWSFGMAALTVAILLVVCYPAAYGMAKLFGKWSIIVTFLFLMPMFVSENVRLFGWFLFHLPRSGVLAGIIREVFGAEDIGTLLYTPTSIIFGLVYVYLPFVLFPMTLGIAMIPKDLVVSARDLGASRFQIFREIEIPIAMPGILVGGLLSFVLAVGAISESKVLGGMSVITIANEIQHEFTYAQNWPMGSALATIMIGVVAVIVTFVMGRLDLDALLGRK